MSTLPFLTAAAQLLAPGRDHSELAGALARRVDAEAPLFTDDADRRKTGALGVAVLFREGSLGLHVEGDFINGKPTSWCSAQVNLSPGAKTREGWTGPELRDDPDKCVTVMMRMLRASVRVDPKHPVAFYARGPRWRSVEAQRLSNDRMALAAKLRARVIVPDATEASSPGPTGSRTSSGAALRCVTSRRRGEDSRGEWSCVGGAS